MNFLLLKESVAEMRNETAEGEGEMFFLSEKPLIKGTLGRKVNQIFNCNHHTGHLIHCCDKCSFIS